MLRGSPKENVLPQDAAAWINYRIAPGSTAAGVLQRARDATSGLDVQLGWDGPAYDPSPVSSSTSSAYRLLAVVLRHLRSPAPDPTGSLRSEA
jgi:carboxypeptidase PM20D1